MIRPIRATRAVNYISSRHFALSHFVLRIVKDSARRRSFLRLRAASFLGEDTPEKLDTIKF